MGPRRTIRRALAWDPWSTEMGWRTRMAVRIYRGQPTVCHTKLRLDCSKSEGGLQGVYFYNAPVRLLYEGEGLLAHCTIIGRPNSRHALRFDI